MAVIHRIIASLMVLVILSGCDRPYRFEGKWRGDREVAVTPETDPLTLNTLSRLDLTVTGDKFSLFDSGVPKTGLIRFAGKTATLEFETAFRRPIEGEPLKPATLTVRSEDELELRDPNHSDEKPIVLRREAQPTP